MTAANSSQGNPPPPIDRLIVLSFAGRSFDCVFGRVESSSTGAVYDGVVAGGAGGGAARVYSGSTDEVMRSPSDADRSAGFAPEMLPVHTMLAREFTVFDAWYSTGADPLFIAVGAAIGAGVPWALYSDTAAEPSSLVEEHPWLGTAGFAGNRRAMCDFAVHAQRRTLPALVVVEPRSIVSRQDFSVGPARQGGAGPADARAAEGLLHEVYDAVRRFCDDGTLLVVTARDGSTTADHREHLGSDGALVSRVPAFCVGARVARGGVVSTPCRNEVLADAVATLAPPRQSGVQSTSPAFLRQAVDPDRPRVRASWPGTSAPYVPADGPRPSAPIPTPIIPHPAPE